MQYFLVQNLAHVQYFAEDCTVKRIRQMITKTETAVKLWRSGQELKALAIFKTFRIGLNSDERRALQIAHESQTGKAPFYQSIGIDTAAVIAQANQIVNNKFLNI